MARNRFSSQSLHQFDYFSHSLLLYNYNTLCKRMASQLSVEKEAGGSMQLVNCEDDHTQKLSINICSRRKWRVKLPELPPSDCSNQWYLWQLWRCPFINDCKPELRSCPFCSITDCLDTTRLRVKLLSKLSTTSETNRWCLWSLWSGFDCYFRFSNASPYTAGIISCT